MSSPAAVPPAATVALQQACRVYGPGDLRLAQAPVPALPAEGVLVRIAYGGICGSDLHYASAGRNGDFLVTEPLTLGHEVVGTVLAVGPHAPEGTPAPGTPVAIHPATPCPPPGTAHGGGLNLARGGGYLGSAALSPHVQGGFTPALAARADQLRPLPEGLPLRRAALAEPQAVALHGVDRAGDLGGARVVISGAGPIGLLALLAARHRGAAHVSVTDLAPRALETATRMGANATVNLREDPPLPAGSADVVIEASGAPAALAEALRVVADGGTIVQLGILPGGPLPLPIGEIIAREITLRGAWRFDVELDEALRLLAAHPEADAAISHVLPLERAAEAFALAADSAASSKVLLEMSPAE